MLVLLVSSHMDTHGEATDHLRAAGCTMATSGHAADALHKMGVAVDAATPFELVIVDRGLSGIDAQMFAELVCEDDRIASARLVLLGRGAEDEFGPYAAAGYAEQVAELADAVSQAQLLRTASALAPTPPAASVPETERPHADAVAGAPILLVEDNEINMEVAREMIKEIGYRCDHAADGHEAVEAVQRCRYGLVLMDCQMPSMDGYEATRLIRAGEASNARGRRVPIVAVTAHAMKGDRERCIAVGMDDYMTKPLEVSRLADTISKWLVPDEASE